MAQQNMGPDTIDDLLPELVALRRDLHAHPELAFEERRTAGIVAASLRLLGLEVHEGLAGTGVVGTLRHGSSTPRGGPARRHGCVADGRAVAPRLCEPDRRRAPRLRPRRPHRDAARRGPPAGAHAPLRRHGALHLPAGRGGPRRCARDGRGGPVRALPVRRGVRAAQLARPAAGPCADASRARSWRRPTASTSCCAAAAAMPRSRTARPTCCSRRASSWGSSTPSSRAASTRPNRPCCPSPKCTAAAATTCCPPRPPSPARCAASTRRRRTASRPRCATRPPASRWRMASRPT